MLANLTIVDCLTGIEAEPGTDPNINSCILSGNDYDLYNCTADYSFIQEDLEDGLIAYWKLDGNANDYAGTNHGTIYGATTTTGQVNNALYFDGIDDYVNMAQTGPLGNSQRTITAWAKTSSEAEQYILCYGGSLFEYGTNIRAGLSGYGGCEGVTFDICNGAVTYSASVADGKWHHYTFVIPDMVDAALSDVRLYQDGILLTDVCGSDTLGRIIDTGSIPIEIGRFFDEPWYYFDGSIDEVMIFDSALSAGQIEAMYEAGLAGHELTIAPLFADPNNGDYHLLSRRGRYRASTEEWILDNVTSPCVDGGDPYAALSQERFPNGGRINMGAYGGTSQASMSEWPFMADLNLDGIVNMIDFGNMASEWLEELPWAGE